MACRIPFDVCSGCGHKARTRAEYCKAATCKYGGCHDNLGKIAADGHILHVDNPNPSFFDISNVFRPADRTAYGVKADWLAFATHSSGNQAVIGFDLHNEPTTFGNPACCATGGGGTGQFQVVKPAAAA